MSKTLASLFASLAFILIGGRVFLSLMSTELSDVIHIIKIAGMGAIAFGIIGYFMGELLNIGKDYYDNNKGAFKRKDKELLIDDLLTYDIGVRHTPKEVKEESEENNG